MRDEIDQSDLMILKFYADNKTPSIRELQKAILFKTASAVMYRLRKLEGLGLLAPPPKYAMHRSRKITEKGLKFMRDKRLI